MKVSEQLKYVNDGFEISNHAFLNQIILGVQRKIQQDVPGLSLKAGEKSEAGTKIKVVLTGSVVTADTDEHERISRNINNIVNDLKNPFDLLALID